MLLTYKFNYYPEDNFLHEQCKISKNLYNQTLYITKQELDKNKIWLRYNKLDKILRYIFNLEGNFNYLLLKSNVAQNVLKQVDNSVSTFFKSIKDYKLNPLKYKGQPKFPKYKKDINLLTYTNHNCQIKNGNLILDRKFCSIKLPQQDKYDFSKFQQVRVIPKNNYFEIEVIYKKDIINVELDQTKFSSIDFGINNLVTLVGTDFNPILFSGKILKSYNQFYNKIKSKLISIKDKMKFKGYTNKLYELENNRNNFIKDFLHKVSRKIINLLIDNKIGTLVVGYNKQWKDSISLGNKTNQTFVSIPYYQLLNYLKYKCEMVGIKMIETEESYTSKCSCLDLESIEKHEDYKGKRIKRGLFKSNILNKVINADVNGALNILRKVIDESFVKKIINRGLLFNPIKIKNPLIGI